MNTIIKNNKEYKLIAIFDDGYDSKGIKFSKPKNNKEIWLMKDFFIDKLTIMQLLLEELNKAKKNSTKKDCLLCNDKDISTKHYQYKKFIWDDSLVHYINKHNYIPDELFQDVIFFFKLDNKINLKTNLVDKSFIKINQNQLLILDALLKHGGYTKKYFDLKNKEITRYSEHAGLLDFNINILEKIVVAGNTTRVDKGDNEIFLPLNLPNYKDFEYIFHTHPPTPKPGGRANVGILYEFPSMGDILHFIDSFNDGKVCGSLVIASEGLYNIRKTNLDHNKIEVNEDLMFKEYNNNFMKIQNKYIDKYGIDFTQNIFFSQIAQDLTAIKDLNKILNKYLIHIDYYPRVKHKNDWILNIVYLPIY